MSAATFLHTGMRIPASESRSHELETLIAALDKDDFNKSLFAQFNALHPKLGNTLEEVEDFKRSGKIPPAHVLAEWREMGEQVSAKGHENLGQALTNATEIYGHLQAIQNDGDVVGATMGLLGSLQNGFSKSRNGGFIGGIYQQLNDLSRQISTVYFHLSHQIEAANQRNIREHQTTRYDLAVMARGIQGYLDTLQRSSSEQGACMVHYMQNLGGRLDNVSQHTNYMLDELAMDPFQQALFSIDSQYAQDKPQPERVTAQLEVLERWLNQPPIKQKLNGTFFAQQPKEEQLAFLRGIQPTSPQFVGFMAQLLKQEGVEDIPNVPLMGAILSGYEKAQLKLIEAHHDRDSQALVLKEIEKRLATMIGVVQKLKSRETFTSFVQKQHKALENAQQAAQEAVKRASDAVVNPIYNRVQQALETNFQHAVEKTFDAKLHPHTQATPPNCNTSDIYCFNLQRRPEYGGTGHDVVNILTKANADYKKKALIFPLLPKIVMGNEHEYVAKAKPHLHHAVLTSPEEDIYLRPVLLPLQDLQSCSLGLRQAFALEQMGEGRVTAKASLLDMDTNVRLCDESRIFNVSDCSASLKIKLSCFYTARLPSGQEETFLLQEDTFPLPSVGTDPLHGVFWSSSAGIHIRGIMGPLHIYGWNPDALGLVITARWDEAVKKEPAHQDVHNEALIQQKFELEVKRRIEQVESHMTYEATAAKALLDQAKADYEHARLMLCSYAEWMGMEMPKYPIASSKINGEFLKPLPAAPVFREPPKTAVETAVESLQHTIPQVRVNLAKRRSQQVEVVDEQKESDEMGQLKDRVEAQDQRIQDLMAIVLMQQKMIVQMQQKDED